MTDRNTKLERKPDRWRDKTITRQTEGQPNRQLYAFFIVWGFCLIIKLRNKKLKKIIVTFLTNQIFFLASSS